MQNGCIIKFNTYDFEEAEVIVQSGILCKKYNLKCIKNLEEWVLNMEQNSLIGQYSDAEN